MGQKPKFVAKNRKSPRPSEAETDSRVKKTHRQSRVLIQNNPLNFSAKLYETYFGNDKEGSRHPPPSPCAVKVAKWRVPASAKYAHRNLRIIRIFVLGMIFVASLTYFHLLRQ